MRYGRTDDGVVHIVVLDETCADWGYLACGLDFGLGQYPRTEDGHVWVDLVEQTPTCLRCVGAEKRP